MPKPVTTPSALGPDRFPPNSADAALVTSAYRKLMAREELTRAERHALKRHEREKEERLRWQYYRSIPQKHWREMSGRQTKVLHEQAARYGLPFGGATIDLPKLAQAMHDFLAENAVKLAREDNGSPKQVVGSPAMERFREERAAIAKLDRLEREGKLLPRDDVREALGRIAAILRSAGDTLQRQFGGEALEVLNEALDDARREMDRSLGGGDDYAEEEAPVAAEASEDGS